MQEEKEALMEQRAAEQAKEAMLAAESQAILAAEQRKAAEEKVLKVG